MRTAWLMPMSMALMACGSAGPGDASFREHVALTFAADCRRAAAPTPEVARTLQRLCDCAVGRIRSGDIAFGDGQDAVTAKVRQAQEACLRDVYGDAPESGNAAR